MRCVRCCLTISVYGIKVWTKQALAFHLPIRIYGKTNVKTIVALLALDLRSKFDYVVGIQAIVTELELVHIVFCSMNSSRSSDDRTEGANHRTFVNDWTAAISTPKPDRFTETVSVRSASHAVECGGSMMVDRLPANGSCNSRENQTQPTIKTDISCSRQRR
jgi:hypothetical protein